MDHVINLELLGNPVNWVIVFLVLYAAALATHFVMNQAGAANINL
jgi:hypothetical protein